MFSALPQGRAFFVRFYRAGGKKRPRLVTGGRKPCEIWAKLQIEHTWHELSIKIIIMPVACYFRFFSGVKQFPGL
jgi:hypothetical protein